eukprot:474851_1
MHLLMNMLYALFYTSYSETQNCDGDCLCTDTFSACIMNCDNDHICQNSILTCQSDQECIINCNGDSHSCQGATINAQNAQNTFVNCTKYRSCDGLQINCPKDYECTVKCNHGATSVCANMIINGSLSSIVTADCDQTEWMCCYNSDIYCGNTCNILCNAFGETKTYDQGCSDLYIDISQTNIFNLQCDDSCDGSDSSSVIPKIITSNQTTNLTYTPSTTPIYALSTTPTYAPSTNPTQNDLKLVYGITIELSFNYVVDTQDTLIIKQIITNIINNTIVTENINVIDCIDAYALGFTVQHGDNDTFINVTMSICDQSSQNIILIAWQNNSLYRELLDKADKKGLIIDLKATDINIVGDIIHKFSKISTTTYILSDNTQTKINNGQNKQQNNITNILISIAAALFMFVVIICLICFYKIKKLDSKKQRQQLQQEITAVTPANITTNIDNIMCIEQKKHDNDEQFSEFTPNGNDVYDHDEGKSDSNKVMIKQWLEDVVELPQYYDTFINNGFESIQFIQEIADETELVDIDIVITNHQTTIMNAIKELRSDSNEMNDIEITTTEGQDLRDSNHETTRGN